jgi:hypothetical protein
MSIIEDNPAVYFRVWGADNIAYGPVELPALINWVRDDRVLRDSWIFQDAKGEWKRAGEMPELGLLFKSKPGSAPTAGAAPHGITPGALRRIKIFADMDERQLTSFLQYMEVRKYPQFSTVVLKGQHGDAMFLVLEGELRARVLVDGKESTLSTMGVGDCFGELALVDQGPRSADVVANKETVLLKISAEAMKRLFQEAPALAAPFLLALMRALAARLRALTKRYEDSIHFARTASDKG